MVPRVEMLLDTLARIIRLIRNNRRHSGYDQIQKSRRGDESSLDLGCKIRRDVKETNIISFFLFMYILRVQNFRIKFTIIRLYEYFSFARYCIIEK